MSLCQNCLSRFDISVFRMERAFSGIRFTKKALFRPFTLQKLRSQVIFLCLFRWPKCCFKTCNSAINLRRAQDAHVCSSTLLSVGGHRVVDDEPTWKRVFCRDFNHSAWWSCKSAARHLRYQKRWLSDYGHAMSSDKDRVAYPLPPQARIHARSFEDGAAKGRAPQQWQHAESLGRMLRFLWFAWENVVIIDFSYFSKPSVHFFFVILLFRDYDRIYDLRIRTMADTLHDDYNLRGWGVNVNLVMAL